MNHFTYRGNSLFAEDVAVSAIAASHGTPCYIYSRAALEAPFMEYQAALEGADHLICYAVKANSNLAVLDVLARLGAGFDIVSGGELERVVAAGGDPAKNCVLRCRQKAGTKWRVRWNWVFTALILNRPQNWKYSIALPASAERLPPSPSE